MKAAWGKELLNSQLSSLGNSGLMAPYERNTLKGGALFPASRVLGLLRTLFSWSQWKEKMAESPLPRDTCYSLSPEPGLLPWVKVFKTPGGLGDPPSHHELDDLSAER